MPKPSSQPTTLDQLWKAFGGEENSSLGDKESPPSSVAGGKEQQKSFCLKIQRITKKNFHSGVNFAVLV